jgi:hypothetical protein
MLGDYRKFLSNWPMGGGDMMTDVSETETILLQYNLVETNCGHGIQIVIAGIATEAAARAIGENIRCLLRENTQQIFGDRRLLS